MLTQNPPNPDIYDFVFISADVKVSNTNEKKMVSFKEFPSNLPKRTASLGQGVLMVVVDGERSYFGERNELGYTDLWQTAIKVMKG